MTTRPRLLVSTALPLVLAMGATSPTWGQAPLASGNASIAISAGDGSSGASPRSRIGLVLNKAVQEDLKLTDDQKSSIAKIDEARRKRLEDPLRQQQEELQRLREANGAALDPQTIRAVADTIRMAREEADVDAEVALRKVLQPKQRTRVDQIKLQVDGPQAFARPELLEKLNLDQLQLEQIEAILNEGQASLSQPLMLSFGQTTTAKRGEEPASRKELEKSISKDLGKQLEKRRRENESIRSKMMQALGKVLTRGQKATYRKLCGEPFDLKKLQTDPTARISIGQFRTDPASAPPPAPQP